MFNVSLYLIKTRLNFTSNILDQNNPLLNLIITFCSFFKQFLESISP